MRVSSLEHSPSLIFLNSSVLISSMMLSLQMLRVTFQQWFRSVVLAEQDCKNSFHRDFLSAN